MVIQIFIIGIAVIGLNIMVGYTGELVLAQGAFMGVGAYTTINLIDYGLGLLPSALVGGLLAALVGVFAGLPSYRVKGYYVAVSTLALQFIAEWFFANREAEWLTGGPQQFMPARIDLFAGSFSLQAGSMEHYYFMLGILLVTVVLTFNLSRSSIGRSMRAVRDNDIASDVLGIQVFKTKLTAYFVGGFFIGLAGGLWAFQIGIVDPGHYSFAVTIEHYTILILGGLGYVWGALIGTSIIIPIESLLIVNLPGFLQTAGISINTGAANDIIFGMVIIIALIFEPKGVIAILGKVKEYLRRWPFSY
jgi:branched-chain amino acid transport system permease protein